MANSKSVCIARAPSNIRKMIFADEPTGKPIAADNAAGIVDLTFDLNRMAVSTCACACYP
ncbi:MAG: hypothetical protein IPK76_16670 [Lewinellaceae bacterium]|nr:hypothetical protein [Lewinellaceae bacterium]